MFPNGPYFHPVGSFTVPMVPPGIDPLAEPLTTVNINCTWLPYIRGALTQLLLQSTWTVSGDDLGVIQSQVWRLINAFGDIGCEMCDCIVFNGGTPYKFAPDGMGGGNFQPIDPRTEGSVPAPWTTPPAGQSGRCLSGANLEAYFSNMMSQTSAYMGVLSGIATLLIYFEQFLALTTGPFGIIVDYATSFAAAAIDAGATLMGTAFDTATQTAAYTGIECLFNCNANFDGSYNASEISLIKAEFYAKIDTWVTNPSENILWRLFFPDFLDSQGPNGLTALGKVAGIVS